MAAFVLVIVGVLLALIHAGLPGLENPPAAQAPAIQPNEDPPPKFLWPEDGPPPAEAVARIGSPRFRHGAAVTALAYSPDGRWLASKGAPPDSTVRVWEAATGREQLRVNLARRDNTRGGPKGDTSSFAFSADSTQLIVLDDPDLRGFDIHSGKERFSRRIAELPPVPKEPVYLISSAISPDGKTYGLLWRGRNAEIRDVASGKILCTTDPLPGRGFGSIVFSKEGKSFALVAIMEEPIPVYETNSGRLIGRLPHQADPIPESVCFLPGGSALMQLKGKQVTIHDIKTESLLRTCNLSDWVRAVTISPNGKQLFAGAWAGKEQSHLIELESGKIIASFPSTPSPEVWCVAFSPDEKFVAGAHYFGGAISVWNLAKRRLEPFAAEPTSFQGTIFSPDGHALILPPRSGFAVVDWRTGDLIHRLAPVDGWACQSPDGKHYATQTVEGPIFLRDAQTGRELRKLSGPLDRITGMSFSGNGQRLACITQDTTIRVWTVADGRLVAQMKPLLAWFPLIPGNERLAISHDGRVLAQALYQANPANPTRGSVVLSTWDVESQKQLTRMDGSAEPIDEIILSPDGRLLAGSATPKVPDPPSTDGIERPVTVWNAITGRMIHSLPGHVDYFGNEGASRDFTPDSRLLATGDGLGRLRLWEMATGQEVHEFKGHHSAVSANFSPDGKLLVATSNEAPCFIWDVAGTATKRQSTDIPDVDALWATLADRDGAAAFQAARRLAAITGPAIKLIRQKIKLTMSADLETAEKLLVDLDSRESTVREMASAELMKLADRIAPRLRVARAKASPEVRRRLNDILGREATPSPERLRQDRALMALEWIGTPEATQALTEIAGDDRRPLTFAAEAAGAALNRREKLQSRR